MTGQIESRKIIETKSIRKVRKSVWRPEHKVSTHEVCQMREPQKTIQMEQTKHDIIQEYTCMWIMKPLIYHCSLNSRCYPGGSQLVHLELQSLECRHLGEAVPWRRLVSASSVNFRHNPRRSEVCKVCIGINRTVLQAQQPWRVVCRHATTQHLRQSFLLERTEWSLSRGIPKERLFNISWMVPLTSAWKK